MSAALRELEPITEPHSPSGHVGNMAAAGTVEVNDVPVIEDGDEQSKPNGPEVNVGIDTPLANIAAELYEPGNPNNRDLSNFRPYGYNHPEQSNWYGGGGGAPHTEAAWGIVRLDYATHKMLPLEALPELGTRIAAHLGNGAHVPRFILPPFHKYTGFGPSEDEEPVNNDLWLETIHAGYAPIVVSHKFLWEEGHPISPGIIANLKGDEVLDRSKLRAFNHDLLESHTGNYLLRPLSMQQAWSECAGHTLQWRQDHGYKGREAHLILPNETGQSPLPYEYYKNNEAARNTIYGTGGIDLIDATSDNVKYLVMIEHMSQFDSAEQVDQVVDDIVACAEFINWDPSHISELEGLDESRPDLQQKFQGLPDELLIIMLKQTREMQAIANFNKRHETFNQDPETARNITPEEAAQAAREYIEGVRDIVHKLRGDVPLAA